MRFINQDDIVPRVPIDPIYRHTGLPKHIVRPGVLEMTMAEAAPDLSEEQSERVEALRRALGRPTGAVVPETAAAEVGPGLVDEEPPMLTREQFADLQYGLGAVPAEGDGTAETVPEGAISIPAFDDHAIAQYIALLRALAAKA